MSTPKIRGKSAIHINESIIGADGGGGGTSGGAAAAAAAATASAAQHALLKIESVVPKLTNRSNNNNNNSNNNGTILANHSSRLRTFHRSHSTLSSSYLKKLTQRAVFAPRPEIIGERNRSRPFDDQPPPPTALDSTLVVQNGISSIRRSQKDREKHPDRVNLDRKGLSSVPIIEGEPNLRLLSLQHNLINSFHIPPDADPNNNLAPVNGTDALKPPPATTSACPAYITNNATTTSGPPTPTKPSPTGTPTNGPGVTASTTTNTGPAPSVYGSSGTVAAKSVKQFLRQKSTSRGQLLMGQNLATLGSTAMAGAQGGSAAASFIQSKMTIGSKQSANTGTVQMTGAGPLGSSVSPHLQKHPPLAQSPTGGPIAITAQQKSLLKKSNSFIGGPNMFLTGGGQTQPMAGSTGSNGLLKLRAGKLLLVPSFSIDNLSNITAELPAQEQEYYGAIGHPAFANGANSSSASNSGKTTPTSGGAPTGGAPLLQATSIPLMPVASGDGAPGGLLLLPATPRYNLGNLVFLDLYDNQIERISCLDGLKSLTVLLLGKNRITDIGGLISLKGTLRVLDLHGNKISNITGKINQLQELKSLNLAGNALRQIQAQDFAGLFSLKELNLKRNRIKRIGGFDDLHNLERLWLCHNDLQCVEDMAAIAKAINLKEVTIENNPVSLAGDCVSFLVSYLPGLVSLSQMQITEQVRRAASAWRKNKELSDTKYSSLTSDVCQSIRREEIISNARTNWELLRSQQSTAIARGATQQRVTANEVDLEIGSNLSLENGGSQTGGKFRKATNGTNGTSSNGRGSKVSQNGTKRTANRNRLVRSSSHDNSGSQLSEQGGEEYFRLPPILAPFLEQTNKVDTESTVTSNVGAHADSSVSSGFSSDNDEQLNPKDLDRELEKEPPTLVACSSNSTPEKDSETPPAAVPSIPAELEMEQGLKVCDSVLAPATVALGLLKADTLPVDSEEKLSTLSTLSTKSASESVITNVTGSSSGTGRTTKSKLNTPIKRYAAGGSNQQSRTATANNGGRSVATGVLSNVNSLANSSNLANSGGGNATPSSGSSGTGTMTGSSSSYSGIPSSNYGPPVTTGGGSGGKSAKSGEREREQGGDYLIEICGRYLNVYGLGALRFIDKQWNMQKACDVHTVKFSYINFNSITAILCRIKVRFVNAENFIFRETNITCLGQINALAESQGIASLTIDPEGNPLAAKPWRSYAIYRLSHWGLKQVNGTEVTAEEVQTAESMYAGLSDLVLWSLPEGLLQPLLQRLRLEETAHASKMTAKEWLMQADPSLKNIVGKEALQWKKHSTTQDDTVMRAKGKAYFGKMLENTCNAVEKLQRLETMWPSLLLEMIRNTLIDYSQIDVYVKGMLVELLK
ncbi:mucin-19 [Anopheles darlingi]|uniref:mucin-19 n=1 Tax=Anopheles darlingi TaxID=43151 RepID=UPI0021001BAE|nr:mucin-19 [Anopheles darlingi]